MKLGWFVAVAMTCMSVTAAPVFAQDTVMSGPAEAIDADIISLNGKRLILWGIDAPDRSQLCLVDNKQYSCWDAALRELSTMLTEGPVTCTLQGKPDRLGRPFGVCMIGDKNINEEMVRGGFAMAYTDQSDEFVPAQDEAKAAGVQLWQPGMNVELPWKFRMRNGPGGLR